MRRTRNQLALFDSPVAALNEKPQPKKQSPIAYILEQQKLRTRQDLLKWRVAVDAAENILNPDRELLHNIYRQIILDPNLSSNFESRKMKVKTKPFKVVNDADEEDKELTKILQSPWFIQWLDAVLDSHLWGYSLIEFGPLDTATGEFLPYQVGKKVYDPVTVIDRDNVKPEFGIITTFPGQNDGVSFFDPQYADYLMYVGSLRPTIDTCILGKAAKYILFKDNALGNWSEWAEVFGMDKRIGYTDADGPARDRFIRAIQNIGANAYGVFTTRDKVEYLGTNRTDAFGVYKELIRYIDEQTSKLVFGQDVVTNNTGRVVGEVGENVANMYGDSDAMMVESLVNKRLFPFMENLGFPRFKGFTFKWDTTEHLSLKDRAEVDFKIHQMGMDHSEEYINGTYGTEVTKREIPQMEPGEENPVKINEKLRSMYGGGDTE